LSDAPLGIDVFDLDSGQVDRLFSTELALSNGMTASPDGRWVLLSIHEPDTSDIMLVEGFR
jgi:sugar lactone lactonase YvrE